MRSRDIPRTCGSDISPAGVPAPTDAPRRLGAVLRRQANTPARIVLFGAAAALTLVLAACGPTDPAPSATPTSAPTSSEEPAAGPVLVPDGSAADNLPLFSAITAQVWATDQRAKGRAYIDALTAAGFDKAAMQVTPDATTVDRAVESMQFSVRWGTSECLIGQVGPSTGDPVTIVMPQLAEGRCLIGDTRPIDW